MNATATPVRRNLNPPQPAASPFPYHPGSLLSVLDLSLDAVSHILARATALEDQDPLVRDRILAKRRVALLFYESSTRTRTSFELAAKSLGADTTLISSLSSSIEKGESLKDTGLTLRALGAEAIILRHNSSGAPWLLEEATRLPVLNAGDGMHEHPTQALLDLRTILTHLRPGIETASARTRWPASRSRSSATFCTAAWRDRTCCCCRGWARGCCSADRRSCCRSWRRGAGPGIEIERDFEAALRAVAGGHDAAHPGRAAGGAATRSGGVQGQLPTHRQAAG